MKMPIKFSFESVLFKALVANGHALSKSVQRTKRKPSEPSKVSAMHHST